MLSLRCSLSEFLHCFLHLFCCTVLVLGEVDIAFIDVTAEGDQNTTLANIVGTFARIGGIKQIDGELKELDSCNQEDPDETQVVDDKDSWIGVIRIPVSEYYNARGSRSCSILERVKKAMFLGASAIIIMTLNHRVIKKLDLVQMFSRPIVISNSTNTSKIVDALQSGRTKLRGKITYNSSLIEVKLLSTLTLWATCGRPSGWEGVVCLGNPETTSTEEVSSHFIGSSSFFASVLFCLLVFKTHVSQLLHNYWISKKEEMLRQETAEALSKLKIRKYKRAALSQRSFEQRRSVSERDKIDPEVCAVCLDEFLRNQLVRTLPCGHEFHCHCVDRWLLARRTCPLCKGNIIEWLSRVSAAKSRNHGERFNEGSETIQSLVDVELVRRQNTPDRSHWSSHEVSSSISTPDGRHASCTKKNIISHHRSVELSHSHQTHRR